jgi:hypothetical protein
MAVTRDTLISAEHRLIITASTSQPLGRDLNNMFSREQVENDTATRTDKALLTRGELDLGGMERMLEDMDGSVTISKSLTMGGPRKVLFASSAAWFFAGELQERKEKERFGKTLFEGSPIIVPRFKKPLSSGKRFPTISLSLF